MDRLLIGELDKTLVICYGNALMGNDSFGQAVHDLLPEGFNKMFSHQLLPEMLEVALEYERLIFVDASQGVDENSFYEVFVSNESVANFHHLSPEQFLAMLSALYSKSIKAYVCTAFFGSFEHGRLDDNFEKKCAWAADKIAHFIAD